MLPSFHPSHICCLSLFLFLNLFPMTSFFSSVPSSIRPSFIHFSFSSLPSCIPSLISTYPTRSVRRGQHLTQLIVTPVFNKEQQKGGRQGWEKVADGRETSPAEERGREERERGKGLTGRRRLLERLELLIQ